MDITLTKEEYEAFIHMAHKGAANADQTRALDAFATKIEQRNGIVRYYVVVRWQELDSVLPPGTDFPEVWPPQLELEIEQVGRPIAKVDVDARLAQVARKPQTVLVTRDRNKTFGWTKINDFFK
jgi:hypothetical protein